MWKNIKKINSTDSNVYKYIFDREDCVVESVLYKYPTFEERTVICCSTQSGCPVGCRFCGTGEYFVRSLSAEEIVSQPMHLLESNNIDPSKIKNFQIMVMSMGEPLLNFIALEKAFEIFYEKFPTAKLLISTIAPKINFDPVIEMCKRIPTVGLQFSIHETTDDVRNVLMPFKSKYKLAEISKLGERFYNETGRKPFFNYCVHDKNNTIEDADRLKKLFDPLVFEATISVICEREESIAAANDRQRSLASDFMGRLLEHGFSTRMFDPAGQDDIGGGCGQLWFVQDWMKKNPDKAKKTIGYGKSIVHAPNEIGN